MQTGLAIAKLEAQVTRLVELLANIVSDTKGRVEKKQAQVRHQTWMLLKQTVAAMFFCL